MDGQSKDFPGWEHLFFPKENLHTGFAIRPFQQEEGHQIVQLHYWESRLLMMHMRCRMLKLT